MLRLWILEHAADEETARTGSEQEQWKQAINVAKSVGALPPGEALENHPEIFIYQTSAHWKQIGLGRQAEAYVDAYMLKHLGTQLKAPNPDARADATYAFFNREPFYFDRIEDVELLIKFLQKYAYWDNMPYGFLFKGLNKSEVSRLRAGTLELLVTCSLDLDSSEGSVYVDKWHYKVLFLDHGRRRRRPYIQKFSLSLEDFKGL
jgi:hypothetical protein